MALLYNLLILSLFLCSCSADPIGVFCNTDTNITSTTQAAIIELLLAEIVSKVASTGFIASSLNKDHKKVFGLAQCRGDISSKDCFNCVREAAKQIRKSCPNQVDARIWYDYCFLRYDKENFTGRVDTAYAIDYVDPENVTDPEIFNRKLGKLADIIRSQALLPKNGGLGKGEIKLSSLETLYGLVQCTRDIKPKGCAWCVDLAVEYFHEYCSNRKGCRFFFSSCFARYELYPFFFSSD